MPNNLLDQDRITLISNRVPTGHVLVPAWPRTQKELPRIQLKVEEVRFSTLNHRTRAEQRRAIARAGKLDLFTADPLGPDAQGAQNEILASQEGFPELKEDLRERQQQEPAIITAEGVLINGNRRAAALRFAPIKTRPSCTRSTSSAWCSLRTLPAGGARRPRGRAAGRADL